MDERPRDQNRTPPDRRRARRLLLAGLFAWFQPVSAAQTAPLVRITGGPDETGHNYAWTIENLGHHAVTRVEIPHFQADLCTAPPRWSVNLTHPATRGTDREGVCIATADTPAAAIAPGRSADFQVRIGPFAGASTIHSGTAMITVKFEDGSIASAPATVPRMASGPGRFVPLIGMAVVVGILLAARRLRKRSPADAQKPPGLANQQPKR